MVTEKFKNTFDDFMFKNGYRWHENFFAKYENGIFIRVYAICKMSEKSSQLNVVCLPVPTFCRIGGKHDNHTVEISLAKLCCQDDSDFCGYEVDSSNIEQVLSHYYNVYKQNYKKYFSYISITDYAEKITEYYYYLASINLSMNVAEFYNSDAIEKMNLTELSYVWYRTGKIDKCKQTVLSFVGIYRELLYKKIQLNQINNDQQLAQKEEVRINRSLKKYFKLSEFAEVLLEENNEYLKKIDKQYKQTENQSKEYIRKLFAV